MSLIIISFYSYLCIINDNLTIITNKSPYNYLLMYDKTENKIVFMTFVTIKKLLYISYYNIIA